MENQEDNSKKGKIKFEDKEYSLDSLPKEGKDLIGGLKAAEAQLRMHEDTLKLISISKAKMIGDLKKILENIEPLS
tara:strand:+ start:263 stop:490 length:228 start_codon:yes stop_codon:yes gene_type:complete